MSVPSFLKRIGIKIRKIFQPKGVAECGHFFYQTGEVKAIGQTVTTKVPICENGSTSHCHHCLEEMAIPCGRCLKPIFVGDCISLFGVHRDDLKKSFDFSDQELSLYKEKKGELPDGSIAYGYDWEQDFFTLVGCRRTDCCGVNCTPQGIWMPPGRVERMGFNH